MYYGMLIINAEPCGMGAKDSDCFTVAPIPFQLPKLIYVYTTLYVIERIEINKINKYN